MARTSADITIHRIDGTTLPVPITPEARRTWRLMREDNIRLRWDSATEYRAMVGDWVDDELFGPFYVTEAQDPTIDQSTGAYRHDIRFDREYIGWRNVLHMLVYDDNGSDARKETEWHLTDTLANQLSVVTRNLAVLGYSYTYSVDDVDEASRAIAMSFSGTSIYDALNAMADAWKCEWWVTYNSDYTAGVIHMGRMETSESRYTITLGDNAETVNASKSEAEYANRIFAYGSTRNIPDTYRKTLVFTVTDTQTLAGGTVFRDSARVIRKDMLKIGDTDSEARTVSLGTPVYEEDGGGRQYKAVMSDTVVLSRDTSFGIAGALSYDMVFTRFEISEELDRTWAWRLKVDDTVLGSGSGIFATHETVDGRTTKSLREEVSASATLAAGTHAVTLEIWTDYDEFALSSVTPNSWKLTLTPSGWSVDCPLVYNGNTYTVRFNPQSDASASSFNWFSFPGGVPSGFGVGNTYTLLFSDGDSAGLLMLKVPVSYYTDNMGDSMRMVGQKRLMLPSPGYVQSSGAGVRRVVEKVVIFEEEYPKLDLTVADIQTGTYTDNTEWSDGSRSYGTLPKYTVKLKQSGADFPFRKDYLTTDPLSLVFTSGKLSGMTFGVNFNQADMTYTIAFNEDYGAKLPNGILKPENGDSVVLTGWNTGAIQSLGLVSAAEQRLLADAEAYLSAVSEPSLSLSCAMMSDRMVSDGLLFEGRKVRVVRGNLTVDTRVIGYEYKLDIPEDTPVYECGETDAYSRLRALEKALRASTQSVSSSGNAVSGTSVRPGGVSATLNGSLSWVPGNVESFQPDTFDGNGDKTLTIPTEIGHLAGNNQLPRIGGTIETLDDGAKVVDLLDSSGNRILPSGSLDWFISETYEVGGETKYRLKLNPKYQGIYAEGWMSAGGVSDGGGGGGGGAKKLSELTDVDDNLSPLNGQVLTYDGTKWTSMVPGSGSVTLVGITGGTGISISGSPITSEGYITVSADADAIINSLPVGNSQAQRDDYVIAQYAGGGTEYTDYYRRKISNLFAAMNASDITTALGYTPANGSSYLPLTGGTMTGLITLTSGSSAIYISGSDTAILTGTTSASGNIGSTLVGQAYSNLYLRGQEDPIYRKYNSSGLYTEYQLAYVTSNVASADKLNTARSLWGQSFDGTANVSGDMSSVGKITFTAQSSASSSGNVLEVVTVNGSPVLHSRLPFYSDSWVSGGGVSQQGGGSIVGALKDLSDVDDNLSPLVNHYLYYDGSKWTSRALDLSGYATTAALTAGLATKQDTLTFDTTPTTGSTNPVTSGGVKTALGNYLPLSGGTLTGTLTLTSGAGSIYISGSATPIVSGTTSASGTIGTTVLGQAYSNLYLRGQGDPIYRKYNSSGNYSAYTIYHAGNLDLSGYQTKLTGTVGAANRPIYLNNGTLTQVTSVGEAFLSWGGQNFADGSSVFDAALVDKFGANRFAFLNPSGVSVEYSRNGGSSWTDYSATEEQKRRLFGGASTLVIGKATTSSKATANDQLRITIHFPEAGSYATLRKLAIDINTYGCSGCWCTVRGRTRANELAGNDTWATYANQQSIAGWTGWNVINTSAITTYNNNNSQTSQLQFIFGCTAGPSGNYAGLTIRTIMAYGTNSWTWPSNMSKDGHLYSYDYLQNATFPAELRVTGGKLYLGSGDVYLYVDSSNRIHTNAPIVSDSYISAGGASST